MKGTRRHTGAIHVHQCIWVTTSRRVISSNNYYTRSQALCLPDLIHELALASLHERDPSFGRLWLLRTDTTELRAAQIRGRVEIGGVGWAGSGERGERNDITQMMLIEVRTETGGPRGEGEGWDPVYDGN